MIRKLAFALTLVLAGLIVLAVDRAGVREPSSWRQSTPGSTTPTHEPAPIVAPTGASTSVSTDGTEAGSGRTPNVVTRVGDRYIWNLRPSDRLEYMEEFRGLVEAGWVEAVQPLAEQAADCIDRPPDSDAQVRAQILGTDNTVTIHIGPEEDRREQIESEVRYRQWLASRLQEFLDDARARREACAFAKPADEVTLFDWLEFGLEQDPERFLHLLASSYDLTPMSRHVLPDKLDWVVRNAERLAALNRKALAMIEQRVANGEPGGLYLAWLAYMYGNLTPRPDPVRAYAHALALRRLDPAFRYLPDEAAFRRDFEIVMRRPPRDEELRAAVALAGQVFESCCRDPRSAP